ncbi:hypothetical protein [Metabacillus sp. 84]|uniref:hypothetical protein n=1 Tax=unclassified Metabacillus TaxID=2675274 RepID=UPI003CF9F8D0
MAKFERFIDAMMMAILAFKGIYFWGIPAWVFAVFFCWLFCCVYTIISSFRGEKSRELLNTS